jgi:hypothetical protein
MFYSQGTASIPREDVRAMLDHIMVTCVMIDQKSRANHCQIEQKPNHSSACMHIERHLHALELI